MSQKNTIIGVMLVVACVLCVWYVSTPDGVEISGAGTLGSLGDKTVILGDDGMVYIPGSEIPANFSEGERVVFTATLHAAMGDVYRGPYKPIEILSISRE